MQRIADDVLAMKQTHKRRAEPVKVNHGVQMKLRLLMLPGMGVHVLAEFIVRPRVEIELREMQKSAKRQRYTKAEKSSIVAAAEATSSGEAASAVQARPGFSKVRKAVIDRWSQPKVPKKMGRPSNEEFRVGVLHELIYQSVEKVDSVEKLVIAANVVYSRAIVVQAAGIVRARPEWADDEAIQKLKFSPPWVSTFLEKAGLNRRRVTNIEKVLPPPSEVQAHMEGIQAKLVSGGYTLAQIMNADETGVFYGEKPKNQYVPVDAARASTPETDDKSRFTAMLWGGAAGGMGDAFCIVKCSSAKADLSGTRVLQNLHQLPGFTAADGWRLERWERTLTLKNKKNVLETKLYKRPYLVRGCTVITVQLKAWMDSAGIAMWVDTQFGPHVRDECDGKAAIIWDNCGSHNAPAIQAVFQEWGVEQLHLPPKMTDQLQVMDLLVNAPVKAAIRRDRIQKMFGYFQNWKIERLRDDALPPDQRKSPPFRPPKPTLASGLMSLFRAMGETFVTPKFKSAMQRCFVEGGQAPKADGTFQRYTNHRRGTVLKACMTPLVRPEQIAQDTLAAACAHVETRGEAEERVAEEGGGEEEEEDGGGEEEEDGE